MQCCLLVTHAGIASPHAHAEATPVQVAHFLEADLQPWAAVLADKLFQPVRMVPARRASEVQAAATGSSARATALAASRRAARIEKVWRHLDELAPLGDAVDAVLRASRLPLREHLLIAPAEWQPAVISSHAEEFVLAIDFATAGMCRDAIWAVSGMHVRSIHLDLQSSSDAAFDGGAEPTAEVVCAALASLPNLRALKLSNGGAAQSRMLAIFESGLSRLTRLMNLHLSCNAISAASAVALAISPRLERLTALRVLEVSGNWLSVAGVDMLAEVLCRLSRLDYLDFSRNIGQSSVAASAALADPLGRQTALKILNLSENCFTAAAMQCVAPELARLTRLRHLDLWRVDMPPEGAAALAPVLSRLTALTLLDLSDNRMWAEGMQSLAPSLRCLPQLVFLGLSRTFHHVDVATAFGSPLGLLTALTELTLHHNDLGAAGAAALARGLSRLSHLADLMWECSAMGAAGAAAFAPALAVLTALTSLSLSCNEFGPSGAEALAPALRRLSRLAELDLGGNEIEADGAAALAPALGALTALTSLDLEANDIGNDGLLRLQPALECLTALDRLLLIKSNGVCKAAVAVFRASVPRAVWSASVRYRSSHDWDDPEQSPER